MTEFETDSGVTIHHATVRGQNFTLDQICAGTLVLVATKMID